MTNQNALTATRIVLSAMYKQQSPTRRKSAFAFGLPGALIFAQNFGTEIFYEEADLLQAALYVRRHASPHLRSLSVAELERQLTSFISAHFGLLIDYGFLTSFSHSFADELTDQAVAPLAAAMAASDIFVEPRRLCLFPLSIVKVSAAYKAASFFLLPPDQLANELADWYDADELTPDSFPPIPMRWYASSSGRFLARRLGTDESCVPSVSCRRAWCPGSATASV